MADGRCALGESQGTTRCSFYTMRICRNFQVFEKLKTLSTSDISFGTSRKIGLHGEGDAIKPSDGFYTI